MIQFPVKILAVNALIRAKLVTGIYPLHIVSDNLKGYWSLCKNTNSTKAIIGRSSEDFPSDD